MKNFIAPILGALFAVLVFCSFSNEAQARGGIIIYGYGEEVSTVQELPQNEAFEFTDGTHLDLCVRYDQFELFWLPVWNYGEYKYVWCNEDDFKADQNPDPEAIAALLEVYNLPKEPSPPIMSQIGIKPIIILFLAFCIAGAFSKKEDEKPQDGQDPNGGQDPNKPKEEGESAPEGEEESAKENGNEESATSEGEKATTEDKKDADMKSDVAKEVATTVAAGVAVGTAATVASAAADGAVDSVGENLIGNILDCL